MNFVPSTSHPGKLLSRFWLSSNTSTSSSLGMYGDPLSTALAVSSEGTKIRASSTNNSGPTVVFSTTNAQKYFDVYSYSGPTGLAAITGSGFSGIGTVNGVLDFTALGTFTQQVSLTSCNNVNKVILNAPTIYLYLPYGYSTQSLDVSQCVCRTMDIGSTLATGITLPNSNTYLQNFYMPETRILGGDLIFQSFPNLGRINMSTGQPYVATFNNVDISLLPSLTFLNFNSAGIKILTIGSNTFKSLNNINFYGGRTSARNVLGGNGPMVNVLSMVTQALALTNLDLRFNGLSEAEQGQFLDAFISTAANRVTTAKTLYFNGQILGGQYPNAFNNGIGGSPQCAPNAGLPTVALRAKVANLVTNYAWTITYNKTLIVTVTPLTTTTLRMTYEGDSIVDIWSIGSTVNYTTSDSGKVYNGAYTVIAGSGKIWDLSANNTVSASTYTYVDAASYSPSKFSRSAGVTNGTSYLFPAIPGALSVSFWIRAVSSFATGTQTMFDNRTSGSPTSYMYNQSPVTGFTTAMAGGVSVINDATSLLHVNTLGWVKIYLETDLTNKFIIGNSNAGGNFLASYDISDVRVYNRLWTTTEQADATSTLPDNGVVAKYDFSAISGTTVPDTIGSYPATVQGSTPTVYPNTNPADYYVQTAGPGASIVTVQNTNQVASVQASSTTNFIYKSAVGTAPTIVSTPSLNNANVMAFPGGQVLELDTAVTSGYLGNSPRSFYFVMNIPSSESRNIFGYGTLASRGIYDMLMYGSNIGLHWYGGSVYGQVAVPFGQWCLFRTHYDGAGNVTHQIDNNAAFTEVAGTLNTGTTQTFRLGEGTYASYNGTGAGVSLAHFEAFSAMHTPAQDLIHSNRIRLIYGMTTY